MAAKLYKTHGSGKFTRKEFKKIGRNVIFEEGVRVFHPENIEIGDNVYIGHNTILKAYHKNKMIIGNNAWIGQNCFFHSAGGLKIEESAGVGPGVIIITSEHAESDRKLPLIFTPLRFSGVTLEYGCDIGVGTLILPGITIGKCAIVGAGAVVTKNIPSYQIWAGVPAKKIKILRKR